MEKEEFPIPEFPITIKVVLSRTIKVKAMDYDSAVERITESFDNEEIVLDYNDDFCYRKIE